MILFNLIFNSIIQRIKFFFEQIEGNLQRTYSKSFSRNMIDGFFFKGTLLRKKANVAYNELLIDDKKRMKKDNFKSPLYKKRYIKKIEEVKEKLKKKKDVYNSFISSTTLFIKLGNKLAELEKLGFEADSQFYEDLKFGAIGHIDEFKRRITLLEDRRRKFSHAIQNLGKLQALNGYNIYNITLNNYYHYIRYCFGIRDPNLIPEIPNNQYFDNTIEKAHNLVKYSENIKPNNNHIPLSKDSNLRLNNVYYYDGKHIEIEKQAENNKQDKQKNNEEEETKLLSSSSSKKKNIKKDHILEIIAQYILDTLNFPYLEPNMFFFCSESITYLQLESK